MSEVVRVVDGRGDVVDRGVGRGALLPVPAAGDLAGGGIRIRAAVEADIPFIDGLQKANSKAVGFMFTAQLRGHIEQGHVLIAEAMEGSRGAGAEGPGERNQDHSGTQHSAPQPLDQSAPAPVGYCVGVDKYFKREDTGVIYQMNVVPGRRRGLVGASLLRAMFERSAYGVKLFCCWCAQDLEANRFWEAMGFVPIAFRTGSRKKSWTGADGTKRTGPRIHVFWQKPVRAEDAALAREGRFMGWWYPSQTGGGAMREDRIVLPIPPGTHWSDAKPAVLPGVDAVFGAIASERSAAVARLSLEGVSEEAKQAAKEEKKRRRAAKQAEAAAQAAREASVGVGALRFSASVAAEAGRAGGEAKREQKAARKRAEAEVSKKNDPKLVAMSRELRDRWLEAVAEGSRGGGGIGRDGPAGQGAVFLLEGRGKYDVSRRVEGGVLHGERPRVVEVVEAKRLGAA